MFWIGLGLWFERGEGTFGVIGMLAERTEELGHVVMHKAGQLLIKCLGLPWGFNFKSKSVESGGWKVGKEVSNMEKKILIFGCISMHYFN